MPERLKGKLSSQVPQLTGKLLSTTQHLQGVLVSRLPRTQAKTVTPSDVVQVVEPDAGYAGLSAVTVNKIPSNYGRIVYDGTLTII